MNIDSKKLRLDELAAAVKARRAAGTLTSAWMDQVEAETAEIQTQIKNTKRAAVFMADIPAAAQENYLALKTQQNGPLMSATTGNRLTFSTVQAKSFATKVLGPDDGLGQKTLAPSGAAVVDQQFTQAPFDLGKPSTSLLDVIPTLAHPSPQYSYLRQNVRTNNAAVVPEYDPKPVSVYGVERIDAHADVVAHISEGVPRFWFIDNSTLQGFIFSELEYGLRRAVEALALTAINAGGISTQAYDTSPLATIRKSLTKLETAGYIPSAIVVCPEDWEEIELQLSSLAAVQFQGLPFDPARRALYGVPVAVSIAQADGTAHVIARDSVAVDTVGGIEMQWSESAFGDDWSKNLARVRCESRYGTSIYRPAGVVKATITDAGS